PFSRFLMVSRYELFTRVSLYKARWDAVKLSEAVLGQSCVPLQLSSAQAREAKIATLFEWRLS
ncbi:MAG: hypothetical protein VKM92_09490, partial [Cyanobacteriota bacterium]|nr:hypothetical protein [Cyanobacteriota bacterium]